MASEHAGLERVRHFLCPECGGWLKTDKSAAGGVPGKIFSRTLEKLPGTGYFSVSGGTLLNNVLFCALAYVLWYSQFFGLGMGKSYFAESPVMLAFSWSILMSLNVIFSNVWGIILKEWKGVSRQTIVVLVCGMCLLIFSLLLPNLI